MIQRFIRLNRQYVTSIVPLKTQILNEKRHVRIYRCTRSTMQAGAQHPTIWKIEWEIIPNEYRWTNPVMGWSSSGDVMQATHLCFPNRESAIRFAERHGYTYTVEQDLKTEFHIKSYADNYRTQTMNPIKIAHTK
ncbi:hypothetical protein PCANB_001120 [Pneumocystis canis]|nr:hypothetical protein PCK1_001143 [Pneumocystis canis]KAG5437144.1 hypothetical protein PCANB_001120 [Pneumocystis canis]